MFMLREADRLARKRGIGLLFTGEVVGQRALDQSRAALERAERRAGVGGRLLRPLCSALMPPTDVERSGAVDRQGALRIRTTSCCCSRAGISDWTGNSRSFWAGTEPRAFGLPSTRAAVAPVRWRPGGAPCSSWTAS